GFLGAGTLRPVAARGGLAPFRTPAPPLRSRTGRTGRKKRLVGLPPRQFEPAAIDGEDLEAGDQDPAGPRGAHALPKRPPQLERKTDCPGPEHLHEGLIRYRGLPVLCLFGRSGAEGGVSQGLEADFPRRREPIPEGPLVGPGPKQGSEDQAQGRPSAILSKLDRRQVGGLDQPREGVREGLKVKEERGTTIPVLVRHARFLSVAEGSPILVVQPDRGSKSLSHQDFFSAPKKRVNGVAWHSV